MKTSTSAAIKNIKHKLVDGDEDMAEGDFSFDDDDLDVGRIKLQVKLKV